MIAVYCLWQYPPEANILGSPKLDKKVTERLPARLAEELDGSAARTCCAGVEVLPDSLSESESERRAANRDMA